LQGLAGRYNVGMNRRNHGVAKALPLSLTIVATAIYATQLVDKPGADLGQTVAQTNKLVTAEERLLSAIPELLWTESRLISERWAKPGQNLSLEQKHFSKKGYRFHDIAGETGFNFSKGRLTGFTFYLADAEKDSNRGDAEFVKLYKLIEKACMTTGIRSGDATRSSIDWEITGATNKYRLTLTRRVNADELVERGLLIGIAPVDVSYPKPRKVR